MMASNTLDPSRQSDCVEQTPTSGFGNEGEAYGRCWKDEPDQERVQDHDADIARPARAASDPLLPARCQHFPGCHDGEDAGKGDQPDLRLAGEDCPASCQDFLCRPTRRATLVAGDIVAAPLILVAIDLTTGVALIQNVARRAHPPAAIAGTVTAHPAHHAPRSRQQAAPAARS